MNLTEIQIESTSNRGQFTLQQSKEEQKIIEVVEADPQLSLRQIEADPQQNPGDLNYNTLRNLLTRKDYEIANKIRKLNLNIKITYFKMIKRIHFQMKVTQAILPIHQNFQNRGEE
ncbi:hypothetical protein ABPG73_006866 [Tetrahymena malaccensis]